jgi:hypothetical protein
MPKPAGIPPEGTTIENHRGYMGMLYRKYKVICIRHGNFRIIDVAQILEVDKGDVIKLLK